MCVFIVEVNKSHHILSKSICTLKYLEWRAPILKPCT